MTDLPNQVVLLTGASKYAQDALLGSLRKEVRGPGIVDTYFNGQPGGEATAHTHLRSQDVAQAVLVADELLLHPVTQE